MTALTKPALRLVASSPAKPRPDLLPVSYREAKTKLAVCTRVDECAEWGNKALALASYARQMRDESLLNMAMKIRARAIQRGGQLLLEVKRERGRRTDQPGGAGATRFETAIEHASLSRDQAHVMMRVARVPAEQFDVLVECDKPATVRELAEMGIKKLDRPKPAPYRDEWIDWTSAVQHLAALPACGLDVLAARNPYEVERLRQDCTEALRNLKLWQQELEKSDGRPQTAHDTD